MPIAFTCPGCGAESSVPDAAAGRVANCAACGTQLRVPGGPAAAEFEVVDAEPVALERVKLKPAVVVVDEPPAEADRLRPRKKAKKKGTPGWVKAALVGLPLLAVAGGAGYYFLAGQPPAGGPGGGPAAGVPGLPSLGPPKWAPFTPPGTALSVDLPGAPTAGPKQDLQVAKPGKLDRTAYTLTAAGDDGKPLSFEVAVFTHGKIPAWAQNGKATLAEYLADRDARGLGQPEPVTVDGRQGVRVAGARDGAGEVRLYFGDERAATYLVAVAGDGVGPDHPAVKRVAASIRTR